MQRMTGSGWNKDEGESAPTPEDEEASAAGLALSPWVAERARIEREKHYAARRGENDANTRSKVSQWRAKSL